MLDPFDSTVTDALRAWKTQDEAGIAISLALATSAKCCRDSRARMAFELAGRWSAEGKAFAEISNALAPALSLRERSILTAGWRAGRLSDVLGNLIAYRELWNDTRRRIRAQLPLPFLVLLIASFVAPLPTFIMGKIGGLTYLCCALMPSLLVWTMIRLAGLKIRARIVQSEPGPWDEMLLRIPILQGLEQNYHFGECFSLLSHALGAGVTLSHGLETCSTNLPNALFRNELKRMAQHTQSGNALASFPFDPQLWPPEFAAEIAAGERSGALENTFARLSKLSRETFTRRIELLGQWLPRIIYGLVSVFVIINIFLLLANIGAAYREALNQ